MANDDSVVIKVGIQAEKAPHDIIVGTDVIKTLPRQIHKLGLSSRVQLFSSHRVFKHHGDDLLRPLRDGGCNVRYHLFDDDEENKSMETWQELFAVLRESEAETGEKHLIVNLGGGVVMDVGGFVAATYERGVDYLQLPTTLLGMVDCGIGGKTGVNYRGKNLMGSFHQPRLVLADLNLLDTLPEREVRSGLAEAVKYGVIMDPELFGLIERDLDAILGLDLQKVAPLVDRCFRHKVEVVEQDEEDRKGIRATLNFGHTVGHALEGATDYTRYTHGEAVAIGMICAAEIGQAMGSCGHDVAERIETLCKRIGVPTTIDRDISLDVVMDYMSRDKKVCDGQKRFILPKKIGEVEITSTVPDATVREVMKRRLA